jgi:hypothetical protein
MAEMANKIKLVDNRVELAKSFLLYQFQDKTIINKIVEALVEEIQEVENVIIDMQDLRTLENATGALLDNIGDKLKVNRSNLEDNDYKTAIKVRILRKSNKGTYADIANVFRLLTRDDNPVIKQTHPYVVELTAVLSCISQTSAGIDEVLALFPVNTGVRLIDKPKRPFGFAGNPLAFPLSSILFDTPQGQMSSLIRTEFGIYDDPRFQRFEAYIPPVTNPPVPTISPFLEYTTLAEGSVLTVNQGVWDGVEPITYVYQWFVDGLGIDGETNTTYTLLAGDIDKVVYCRVIADNSDGNYVANSNSVTYTVEPTGGIVSELGLEASYREYTAFIGTTVPSGERTTIMGLRFGTDGFVTPYDQDSDRTPVPYLDTTGASAAADYEVYVTKTSGASLYSPTQIDIWQDLTSNREFSMRAYNPAYGHIISSGSFIFTVRNKTSLISEQKEVTLIAVNDLDNGF